MNKSLIVVLLLCCGGTLFAQGPAVKAKAAPEKKTAVATAAAASAPAATAAQPEQPAAQPRKKAEPAKAKTDEQDAEESVVMIDSKADADEEGTSAAYRPEPEERTVPGGLPLSYGQCKGVIADAGRNLLVFESLDDGTVTFVQVTVGKANISWKLVDRIPRSAD